MSAGWYWLPVSDYAVAYPGGFYRVLGLNPNNLEVGLNRDDAERACIDAGANGLAAPVTEGAIRALTDVIRHSVQEEEIRRDAKSANAACEEGAPFAIHTDYEPRCKTFCFMSTQLFADSSTVKDVITNVKSSEECANMCVSNPACKCAFYILKSLDNSMSETCWLKGVACDSEDLQRYDDSNDAYTQDNIHPCSLNSTVNTCCVHKLQRRYWTAGLRTGFDEADCRGPLRNNGVYPYFSESTDTDNLREAVTRFNNCGSDKVRNWAWVTKRKVGKDGALTGGDMIYWRDVGGYLLAIHWEPVNLVPNGKEQPTGWQGFYTIEGPDPGKYQNCTAAKVYVPGDHSGVEQGSNEVFDDPYSVPWWHDVPCDELLDRWVCSFGDDGISGSSSYGVAVGGSVAAAVLCLVAVITGLLMTRRKRRRRSSRADTALRAGDEDLKVANAATSQSNSANHNDDYVDNVVSITTTSQDTIGQATTIDKAPGATRHAQPVRGDWITMDWMTMEWVTMDPLTMTQTVPDGTYAAAMTAGHAGGSVGQDQVQLLGEVLDHFHSRGIKLGNRWAVLSGTQRRVGGQGLVQFVRDEVREEYCACKFFFDDATFEREAQLYAKPTVRDMMAAVIHMEPRQGGMPAWIVLERGSSLSDWAEAQKPDLLTSATVLSQILQRLERLHELGLVHRDIKPANVLWREAARTWTLIDFGCVVDTCECKEADLSFSLPYAAPEVIHALERRNRTMPVHTSLDIWSIGVVVYELLMKARLFPAGSTAEEIKDQLAGRVPLPWERLDTQEGLAKSRKLGMLRKPVLACLSRDPDARPTAQQLLQLLESSFSARGASGRLGDQ